MNIFAIIAIIGLATLSSASINQHKKPLNERAFESEIRQAAECVKGVLVSGIPELGMPSFDPLSIDSLSIDLSSLNSSVITSGQINLSGAILAGVPNFDFTTLSGSILIIPPGYSLKYGILFPQISFQGTYDFNADVMGNALSGSGSVSFELNNISLDGSLRYLLIGGIDRFDVTVGLGSSLMSLTGFIDDETSQSISDWFTNSLPTYILEHQAEISQVLSDLVLNALSSDNSSGSGQTSVIINEIINRCNPLL